MKLNKTTISTIALLLLLTISIMTCLPIANVAAQTTTKVQVGVKNYAFIAVSPIPLGVGQEATVSMQVMDFPPARSFPYGFFFTGYTLTVTKPDNTTETLGPFTGDYVNFANVRYTPTDVGNYTFQFTCPEQWINGSRPDLGINYDYQYLAATSAKVTLIVQQEPVSSIPGAPLPTDYWQRPINTVNREWSTISGDWLMSNYDETGQRNGAFNPYTTAPDSAHIVWTQPVEFGGVIGGNYSYNPYYSGIPYEAKVVNCIIMYGRVYYATLTGGGATATTEHCVDLRTGQEIWQQNYTVTNGQILWTNMIQQIGGIAYLWRISGTTWSMYDAITGNYVLSIANCTTGTVVNGPNGDIDVYILNGANHWMAMWNSTQCIWNTYNAGLLAGISTTTSWTPPVGGTMNFKTGIQWNVTVPSYNQTLADGSIQQQTIVKTDGDVIIASTNPGEPALYEWLAGYSCKDGHAMWAVNWTLPQPSTGVDQVSIGLLSGGVLAVPLVNDWYGFDEYTGKQIWGPVSAYGYNGWSSYLQGGAGAYGNMYETAFDGMHVFDLKTGQRVWDWQADSTGYDFPGFANYPLGSGFGSPPTIADGKIYQATGYERQQPVPRGFQLYCINASTGKDLWSVMGWFGEALNVPPCTLAEGSLVSFNNYDNQLYCFYKGQSATTVTTEPVINNAAQVLIKGTVTDQSPGNTCLGIPAAGTPAISDESMSQWMEYLYMQQPKPTNATGVPVSIDAIDPNGNPVHLGDTHSDSSGQYAFIADQNMLTAGTGLYTITTTFSGSNSYFSSSGQTAMAYAVPSTFTNATPTAAPTSMADQYFVPAIAGLFVLIIVVAIVLALLMLRKKP